jgi:hypothetical protein
MRLEKLLCGFPVEWAGQRHKLVCPA